MLLLLLKVVAGFVVLFSLGYLIYWLLVVRRTVIVVVHPYHLGSTREDMRQKLLSCPGQANESELQNVIDAHMSYYQRLERFLRSSFCRSILLLEEEEAIEESVERIVRATPHLRYSNFFQKLEFLTAPTEVGFARLIGCTWEGLIEELQAMGIKYIVVVGAYVGMRNGHLLPQRGEGHFCVNETYYQFSRADCFKVYLETDASYVHDKGDAKVPQAFRLTEDGDLSPVKPNATKRKPKKLSKSEKKRRSKQSKDARRKNR